MLKNATNLKTIKINLSTSTKSHKQLKRLHLKHSPVTKLHLTKTKILNELSIPFIINLIKIKF